MLLVRFFLLSFLKKLSVGIATLNIMVQRLRGELGQDRVPVLGWEGVAPTNLLLKPVIKEFKRNYVNRCHEQ